MAPKKNGVVADAAMKCEEKMLPSDCGDVAEGNEDAMQTRLKNNISLIFENGNNIFPIKDKEEQLFDGSTTTKERFSPIWRQSIAAAGSIVCTLSAGMTSGYSATLLPQLKMADSAIQISLETESWIAAIAALPMSAGCIISGVMMEPLGRRMTHLILAIPFVIGWILISTSTTLAQLLIGRFLTGLCVGILGPVGSVYIGETSNPKYRGFLLAGISLAISVGLLLVHFIGTFVSWQMTAGISSIVPFVSYIIMMFVPESPSWLAAKGRTDDAKRSFKWLRGCDQASLQELDALLSKQADITANSAPKENVPMLSKQKFVNLKNTFRRPEFFKPLLIMIALFLTAQFSGINAVAFYSVSIMKSTLGEGFNEYTAMLIIDSVRLTVSVVACVLLRRVGRRPLGLISGMFTVLSLFGLVIFKYSTSGLDEATESTIAWVPLLFLIGYIISNTAGLTPLPWVMTGELFPVDLRGLGSGICTCICFIAFFIVVKCAPAMFGTLGVEGTFLTYGIIALCGTVFMYLFLPETKGKTLQNIEEEFRNKEKLAKTDDDSESI